MKTHEIPADDPMFAPIWQRRDLIAAGHSDRSIQREVAAGRLHRLRHGAYVDGALWSPLDAATRHAVLARAAYATARTGTMLSHVSALPFHGAPVWGFDADEVHLTREDHKAGRRAAGVRQHRGVIRTGDVVEVNDVRISSPTRTALEVTMLRRPEAALVAVCFLLHAGLTTKEELMARLDDSIDRWPATLGTRRILGLADGRVESPGEARFLHVCAVTGLPRPEPRVVVRDRVGRLLGRVDFAWPELGLFVEFDGKEKYVKYRREGESVVDAVIREKGREQSICEATGWRCIRLTWADLASPERIAARIRAVLAGLAA